MAKAEHWVDWETGNEYIVIENDFEQRRTKREDDSVCGRCDDRSNDHSDDHVVSDDCEVLR